MPSPSFTELVLDYTQDYESPESFWRWSSYAIIAAALRSNIYFEHRQGKIYPNIFVLFLADSATFRKGAAIDLASWILGDTKLTKVIEGRNSIQWVIEQLCTDRGALKGGQALLISEELSSFFVDDHALIPILTDMYDFKAEYPYGLKGNQGSLTVKNRCVTLLAASNEQFLREVYDDRAVYGGLMRRTFFVKPEKRRKGMSFFDLPSKDPVKQKTIIDKIHEISRLKGAVTASPDATKLYNDWYYTDVYPKYDIIQDRTGVLGSIHTSALKLAIILAAGESSQEISKANMENAITQVVSLKGNYESYTISAGKATDSRAGGVLMMGLYAAKDRKLTRSEILRKYWSELGTIEEFDSLLNKLQQAEFIRLVSIDNSEGYQLTQKCINQLEGK